MEEAILQLEPETGEKQAAPASCPSPGRRKRVRTIPMRVRLALALGLCVALVLCRVLWPDRVGALRRWIVGDGGEQVQQAFFCMEEALSDGGGLGEAWTAFCTELTDEGA